MADKAYTIVVKPKLEVDCDFHNEYELLIHAQYRNNIPPLQKEYVGTTTNKVCALCDKIEPEVLFSKEAHILPAALGNNKYFSNEECDDCNGNYGEKLENELAIMFDLQRSILGIKGRKVPKIKFHTGEAIGFNRDKNIVEVITQEKGKIEIEKADGELNLSVNIQKYSPYSAVLSLLKSAWLLMDQKNRSKLPLIKSLIKNDLPHSNIHFFSMFYPGNGSPFTSMQIFLLKDESKDLPPAIIPASESSFS